MNVQRERERDRETERERVLQREREREYYREKIEIYIKKENNRNVGRKEREIEEASRQEKMIA